MRHMQAPKPNRRGEYEVHYVAERVVPRLRAQGWTDVSGHTAPAQSGSAAFDMTGPWLSVRKRVRDAVGAERLPSGKAEARQWLHDAGYEVRDV
jgi:hypothetical protein